MNDFFCYVMSLGKCSELGHMCQFSFNLNHFSNKRSKIAHDLFILD